MSDAPRTRFALAELGALHSGESVVLHSLTAEGNLRFNSRAARVVSWDTKRQRYSGTRVADTSPTH